MSSKNFSILYTFLIKDKLAFTSKFSQKYNAIYGSLRNRSLRKKVTPETGSLLKLGHLEIALRKMYRFENVLICTKIGHSEIESLRKMIHFAKSVTS